MGFIFGPLIAVIALGLALRRHRRPDPIAFVLAGGALAYALIYRFVLITKWTDPASRDYARNPGEIVANLAYQAQNLVAWVFVAVQSLLRALNATPIGGHLAIILGVAGVAVVGGLAALKWIGRADRSTNERAATRLSLLALALWLVMIAPSSLLLTQDYVWSSPRMTYVPSIGVALFWGLVASALLGVPRRASEHLRAGAIAGVVVVMCAWSAGFVAARLSARPSSPSGARGCRFGNMATRWRMGRCGRGRPP
jgi:hypothetical protein